MRLHRYWDSEIVEVAREVHTYLLVNTAICFTLIVKTCYFTLCLISYARQGHHHEMSEFDRQALVARSSKYLSQVEFQRIEDGTGANNLH